MINDNHQIQNEEDVAAATKKVEHDKRGSEGKEKVIDFSFRWGRISIVDVCPALLTTSHSH